MITTYYARRLFGRDRVTEYAFPASQKHQLYQSHLYHKWARIAFVTNNNVSMFLS